MNKEKNELTADTEFEFEKYKFQFSFSLDRIGYYNLKVYKSGKLLKKPDFLYKFYGKSTNSLNSLKEGYLYFADPKSFNDPFDCLTNRESYILKGGKEIRKHRENIGICCFSIINNNPLMWGHYTNNYTGFCIKYDNSDLLNNSNVAINRQVSYLKNYEAGNSNLFKVVSQIENSNLETTKKDLIHSTIKMSFEYCWKYIDWKYENEYRAVSINSLEFQRKLNINKNDVQEIYIGHKLKDQDSNYFNDLINIIETEYKNCKIYIVKPDPLQVKLDFEGLN